MEPPPNYKPGVGRGAVGFQTEAERLSVRPIKRGKEAVVSYREATSAKDLWDAIDNRKKRKFVQKKTETPKNKVSENLTSKTGLGSISDEQWANLPEAADFTRRNKRMRRSELMSTRSYAVPTLNDDHNDTSQPNQSSIGDFDRVRNLLEGLCKIEPQNVSGWIGLSRLEAEAGRMKKAKAALARGCEFCAHDPAIWLETLKVYTGSEAKVIAEKAVKACPEDLELWLKLIDLTSKEERLLVLRQSLEYHHSCVDLWIRASELESDPILLLKTALEFVPTSEEIWLKLGELNPQVLDQAPDTIRICVSKVANGIYSPEAAIEKMPGVLPDQWLTASESITSAFVTVLDLSKISEKNSWAFSAKKNISPDEFSRWAVVAPEDASKVARANPGIAIRAPAEFWARFMSSGVEEVLMGSADEDTWYSVAESLPNPLKVLEGAYSKFGTARSAYRLVHALLWSKNKEKALSILCEAIKSFPSNAKLQIQGVQLELWEPLRAIKQVEPKDPLLPVLFAYAVEQTGEAVRKRALLTEAMKRWAQSDILWQKRVSLDPSTLDDALQHCPQCGYLWWLFVIRSPRVHRKKSFTEALQRSHGDPLVLVLLALDRWSQGKSEQSRDLFEKAVDSNVDNGDVWLWYCLFDANTVKRAAASNPCRGQRWQIIRKRPENYRRSLEDLFRQESSKLKKPF